MSIYENVDLVAKAESYLAQAESGLMAYAAGGQDPNLITICQTMISLADTFLCLNDCYNEMKEDQMGTEVSSVEY